MEWSGAVEPILLHWCNEAHDINTEGSVGRFLNLDIQVIKQMWDNVIFALQDEHIKENTELAHVFPNIKKNNYNVLYSQDIIMVQQDGFLGNNQLNFFVASAIQQIDYFGSIKRFHTLECGFMNHLYYNTPNVRNVYRYNNVQRWVKNINLLDYAYVLIPTNNNELHWVIFIIVPAERRVECYDSLCESGGFHYESLSDITRFLKDYQVLNKLPVDEWTWSVKIVFEPKQNNLIDCGVFVCMRIYCMMKGWALNSIPVDAYNSRLRLFIAYSMLKWDIGTEDYSFRRLPAPLENAFRLPYDGATLIFY
jgi:Ulp1 family protease